MDLVQKGLISILVVQILSTFAIKGYSGLAASPLQGGVGGYRKRQFALLVASDGLRGVILLVPNRRVRSILPSRRLGRVSHRRLGPPTYPDPLKRFLAFILFRGHGKG